MTRRLTANASARETAAHDHGFIDGVLYATKAFGISHEDALDFLVNDEVFLYGDEEAVLRDHFANEPDALALIDAAFPTEDSTNA